MKIKTLRGDLEIQTSTGNPVKLRPSAEGINYRDLSLQDPVVAQQLKIHRKHGAVSFDELFPEDVTLLKGMAKASDNEKARALLKANRPKNQKPFITLKTVAPSKPKVKPKKEKTIGDLSGFAEPDKSGKKSSK